MLGWILVIVYLWAGVVVFSQSKDGLRSASVGQRSGFLLLCLFLWPLLPILEIVFGD